MGLENVSIDPKAGKNLLKIYGYLILRKQDKLLADMESDD